MILQDVAAGRLGRRPGTSVVFSDGNALLSAAGRAANYLRPAGDGPASEGSSPDAGDLEAAFRYVLAGKPIPPESRRQLPDLRAARQPSAPS